MIFVRLSCVSNCERTAFAIKLVSISYERLLLSNDKEQVLAVARRQRVPESPHEIIKDPMVLEFLGLERKAAYYEKGCRRESDYRHSALYR